MAPSSSSGSKNSPAPNGSSSPKMPTWRKVMTVVVVMFVMFILYMVLLVFKDWAITSHNTGLWALVVFVLVVSAVVFYIVKLIKADHHDRAHRL